MGFSEYILIAEDDDDDQLLLTTAFAEISAETKLLFVSNGLALLEHFRSYERGTIELLPQLLIVDLNMPKKTGREALSELRLKEYFHSFPTIIFSTTGNEFERQRCKELGIDSYFVKPPNYSELTSIVAEFCKLAYAGRNNNRQFL